MTWLGERVGGPDMQLDSEPYRRGTGQVRVVAQIQYGAGQGERYCDLTTEQAEKLGIALILAAHERQ